MASVLLSELRQVVLPPQLIVDKYIEERNDSYEKYLTEFANLSRLFKKLSNNGEYKLTLDQSHGECDCCSDTYEFDFKLLASQSSIYAASNLSPQTIIEADGKVDYFFPRQSKGMNRTIINPLLARYSLQDLLDISKKENQKFNRDVLSPEGDVRQILKIMECPKNTLYFHSDFVFTDTSTEYTMDEIMSTVEPYMNDCLINLFSFRELKVPDKDTFLAVIICGFFSIAKWEAGRLHFVEHIPLSKSKTYVECYDFVEPRYKKILKIM